MRVQGLLNIQEDSRLSDVVPRGREDKCVALDGEQSVIVVGGVADVDLAHSHQVNVVGFEEELHFVLLALG